MRFHGARSKMRQICFPPIPAMETTDPSGTSTSAKPSLCTKETPSTPTAWDFADNRGALALSTAIARSIFPLDRAQMGNHAWSQPISMRQASGDNQEAKIDNREESVGGTGEHKTLRDDGMFHTCTSLTTKDVPQNTNRDKNDAQTPRDRREDCFCTSTRGFWLHFHATEKNIASTIPNR